MIMQHQTTEELCNLLIQSIEAKDEKTLLKVLDQEDEEIVKEIINKVPVHHVRKLVLELRNILSNKLTVNHLRWLQHIMVAKFTVLASMADGRSVILPLISLLEDRSNPSYYVKMQALKGKLDLLKQLKENRRTETTETVVRLPLDRDQPAHMELDIESETESEEDFDDEEDDDKQSGDNATANHLDDEMGDDIDEDDDDEQDSDAIEEEEEEEDDDDGGESDEL